MADIARKIALFNTALKIAFAHFSDKPNVRGVPRRLNIAIRQRISKGVTDAQMIADEVIKEIETEG